MKYLIDKSALVAEIERRVELNDTCQKISGGNEFYRGAIDEAKEILSFLDTLEVIRVGLDSNTFEDNVVIKTDWEGDWVLNKAQKGEEV